jgi:hypothetical protein
MPIAPAADGCLTVPSRPRQRTVTAFGRQRAWCALGDTFKETSAIPAKAGIQSVSSDVHERMDPGFLLDDGV